MNDRKQYKLYKGDSIEIKDNTYHEKNKTSFNPAESDVQHRHELKKQAIANEIFGEDIGVDIRPKSRDHRILERWHTWSSKQYTTNSRKITRCIDEFQKLGLRDRDAKKLKQIAEQDLRQMIIDTAV